MKELFGSPGRASGLGLRVGQFVFAAASIGVMVSAHGFFNSTAFWSSFITQHHFPEFLQVTSILSLAAASASAGVTILYARDLHYCNATPHFPCKRFQISIALAFISWFLLAVSSHVMFWLMASV
ncbi:unnamed protein product [Linum tenue]|uniref:CASP-like protein n=1 Tax=Linum tenue TaxID=586396 RepID=A0AAV0MBN8_9ROSI|nr:unnamed protein product [Linum tenue]